MRSRPRVAWADRVSELHFRFWLLAALGIMLDGFDFFIIGVASPLLVKEFGLSSGMQGLVTAAAIIGAIFGAGLLGPLADRVGRRRIFRADLIFFVVFSIACVFARSIWSLIAFRFVLGIAIPEEAKRICRWSWSASRCSTR